MRDKPRDRNGPRDHTVLAPLRPAVVIRRRVVDAGVPTPSGKPPPRAYSSANDEDDDEDDDEEAPPSSVDVARALASLRGGELRRLDAILGADDEGDEGVLGEPQTAPAEVAPPTPRVAPLLIGREIALADVAVRLQMSAEELAAALVTRGFYSLTPRSVLARDSARLIAEVFGLPVEDAPENAEPAPPRSKRRAAPAKTKSRAKPATKAKSKAASKKKR